MYKYLIGALAGAMFCSTASAGFVQYDLQNVRFDDGGTLMGYFVQDTDDKSVAFYEFSLQTGGRAVFFSPSGLFDNVLSAATYFPGAGPTSFLAFNDMSDAFYVRLALDFRPAGPDQQFPNYLLGWADQTPIPGMPAGDPEYTPRYNRIEGGNAVVGTIDPALLASLEAWPMGGINHIVPVALVPQDGPRDVPEPASWALLVAGALAARSAGTRYRGTARG